MLTSEKCGWKILAPHEDIIWLISEFFFKRRDFPSHKRAVLKFPLCWLNNRNTLGLKVEIMIFLFFFWLLTSSTIFETQFLPGDLISMFSSINGENFLSTWLSRGTFSPFLSRIANRLFFVRSLTLWLVVAVLLV